jgi:hypothetical protein
MSVGDIFYVLEEPGLVNGPYTLTDELDVRNAFGDIIAMSPDCPVLSVREAIREVRLCYRRFDNDVDIEDEVVDWVQRGFDPREADYWMAIGCYDAAVAAAFRDAGISREAAWYTLNPIDSVRCKYTGVDELINRAKSYQRQLSGKNQDD